MHRLSTRSIPTSVTERFRPDPPTGGEPDDELRRFKSQLHRRLVVGMDLNALNSLTREQLKVEVRRVAEELCQRSPNLLNQTERDRLISEVLDETFGLGPLEGLMRDTAVSDILINGPHQVYVERGGCLEKTDVTFTDAAHLQHIVQRIVS